MFSRVFRRVEVEATKTESDREAVHGMYLQMPEYEELVIFHRAVIFSHSDCTAVVLQDISGTEHQEDVIRTSDKRTSSSCD